MNLSELNELELSNVGNWPAVAKVLVVLVACSLVIFAVYWFDTRHQREELKELRAQEDTLKVRVKQRAAQAANLEVYKRQLDEIEGLFAEMRQQLPDQTEVPELLVDISQKGLAAGLEFNRFQPQRENVKKFYAELPIQIQVTGTYHEFGEFVSGVAELPRIVTLHNISISPTGGGELSMSATAKTYRRLEVGEQGE